MVMTIIFVMGNANKFIFAKLPSRAKKRAVAHLNLLNHY